MDLTEAMVQTKLAELEQRRAQVLQEAQALVGAIQACRELLAQMQTPPENPKAG